MHSLMIIFPSFLPKSKEHAYISIILQVLNPRPDFLADFSTFCHGMLKIWSCSAGETSSIFLPTVSPPPKEKKKKERKYSLLVLQFSWNS